ncbi:hypothetical protein FIA58_002655 [Flavobacterium jejuense]|uniref:Uncharacterized protein n=1 Tax=Flavobacterium jejuense TaxID=1544455 RepID=A0ABX0INE2_9FLAO|nr:hypothetical protein [Flavobacterium jejuense]NHN24565.1 hypothetical protein [Flavobacterium jejuense]
MKKSTIMKMALASVVTLLWSCQTPDESIEVDSKNNSKTISTTSRAPSCGDMYALVLSGGTSTPVPGGLSSHIYKVDLCSSPTVGYSYLSTLKIGTTLVTSVTGICDMPGVPDYAWAVTGANSNFPQKILKFQISTGAANIAANATAPLQDIENYGNTGLYLAIKEATSSILKVNVGTGVCNPFSSFPSFPQFNGLTFVGNKVQVISGLTNYICSPNYGDILEYDLGANLVGRYSYKNLPANNIFTMKELGFHYDNCCKRWVVGSSSGIISNNFDITPCTPSNPIFLLNTVTSGQPHYAIYDFMVEL